MFCQLLDKLRYIVLVSVLSFAAVSHATVTSDQFCWRDSYGRGVGTIPTSCTAGKTYDTGLCYESCRAGYTGVGPVCWQQCPPGYVDTGAFCHINKPLVVAGSWRCTTEWGGICWWWTTDCPAGYGNGAVGLCSLNPTSPPNGMKGTYLDPIKDSYGRGVGTLPTGCPGGEYDAGLCYQNCNAGYDGVGPVCWNSCPAGKKPCGAGCADSDAVCAEVTSNQVISAFQVISTIASGGVFGAASNSITRAESLSRTQQLVAELKAGWNNIKNSDAYELLKDTHDTYKIEQIITTNSPEEAMRIASTFDPTGVAGAVAAFTFPVCGR